VGNWREHKVKGGAGKKIREGKQERVQTLHDKNISVCGELKSKTSEKRGRHELETCVFRRPQVVTMKRFPRVGPKNMPPGHEVI